MDAWSWDAINWRLHDGQGTYGGCGSGSSRRRRRRTGQGQILAEDDAAVLVEHAGQRAAGDAAQHRAQDRRDRRGGRVDLPGQDGAGGAGAPSAPSWQPLRGQAGVRTEGIKPCEAPPARHSCDHGPVSPEPGPRTRWSQSGRPGSRPARTGSGRAAAARTRSRRSTTRAKAAGPHGYGRWTRTWPRRSTSLIILT